ncbi:MAG: hypothetical protein NVSMB66_1240 [Candidatus Doudnabacteria bacterium]
MFFNNNKLEGIDADEFAIHIKNHEATLIDVRTPEEYRLGHISGSRNLDFQESFSSAISNLDPHNTYYLYCRSGGRSSAAGSLMKNKGFTHVFHLNGGISAWNGPIEQ